MIANMESAIFKIDVPDVRELVDWQAKYFSSLAERDVAVADHNNATKNATKNATDLSRTLAALKATLIARNGESATLKAKGEELPSDATSFEGQSRRLRVAIIDKGDFTDDTSDDFEDNSADKMNADEVRVLKEDHDFALDKVQLAYNRLKDQYVSLEKFSTRVEGQAADFEAKWEAEKENVAKLKEQIAKQKIQSDEDAKQVAYCEEKTHEAEETVERQQNEIDRHASIVAGIRKELTNAKAAHDADKKMTLLTSQSGKGLSAEHEEMKVTLKQVQDERRQLEIERTRLAQTELDFLASRRTVAALNDQITGWSTDTMKPFNKAPDAYVSPAGTKKSDKSLTVAEQLHDSDFGSTGASGSGTDSGIKSGSGSGFEEEGEEEEDSSEGEYDEDGLKIRPTTPTIPGSPVSGPTVTVIVPGPIEYVDRVVEVPGPTEYVDRVVEVPGPTVIVAVPGPTEYVDHVVEVRGPTEYVDRLVEVPGPVVYRIREVVRTIRVAVRAPYRWVHTELEFFRLIYTALSIFRTAFFPFAVQRVLPRAPISADHQDMASSDDEAEEEGEETGEEVQREKEDEDEEQSEEEQQPEAQNRNRGPANGSGQASSTAQAMAMLAIPAPGDDGSSEGTFPSGPKPGTDPIDVTTTTTSPNNNESSRSPFNFSNMIPPLPTDEDAEQKRERIEPAPSVPPPTTPRLSSGGKFGAQPGGFGTYVPKPATSLPKAAGETSSTGYAWGVKKTFASVLDDNKRAAAAAGTTTYEAPRHLEGSSRAPTGSAPVSGSRGATPSPAPSYAHSMFSGATPSIRGSDGGDAVATSGNQPSTSPGPDILPDHPAPSDAGSGEEEIHSEEGSGSPVPSLPSEHREEGNPGSTPPNGNGSGPSDPPGDGGGGGPGGPNRGSTSPSPSPLPSPKPNPSDPDDPEPSNPWSDFFAYDNTHFPPTSRIVWTILSFLAHLIFYYLLWVLYTVHREKAIWLSYNTAGEATRNALFYMVPRFSSLRRGGWMHFVFSERWARGLDGVWMEGMRVVGKELKGFPMPG